jgi:hypothetical protein
MIGNSSKRIITIHIILRTLLNVINHIEKNIQICEILTTRFDQKEGRDEPLGRTVGTGAYLTESGTAGTIQQLDPAV